MTYLIIFFAILGANFARANADDLINIENLWNGEVHYSNSKAQYIEPLFKFEHRVPLTLVMLRESGWSAPDIISRFHRLEEIYAQCNISFSPVLLIETNHALGVTFNRDSPLPYLGSLRLEASNALMKPAVYFVANEIFDRNYGGYSWRASSRGGWLSSQKRNSAVLFRSQISSKSSSSFPMKDLGRYEVLAHELGHILFDESHNYSSNNLMSDDRTLRTNLITPVQCSYALAYASKIR